MLNSSLSDLMGLIKLPSEKGILLGEILLEDIIINQVDKSSVLKIQDLEQSFLLLPLSLGKETSN